MSNTAKFNQFAAAYVASMGAITSGSCISWIDYENYRKENKAEVGIGQFNLQFIRFYIVCAIAAFASYFLIRLRGPLLVLKTGAFLTCIVWILAAGLYTFKDPFHTTIYLFALLCGFITAPIPLYVGEISQKEFRGALASVLSLNIKIGILIADMTFVMHEIDILCFIGIAISALQFLLLFSIHEAPFFLILTNQEEQAIESLLWLRGDDYDTNPEFSQMNQRRRSSMRKTGFMAMFIDCFRRPRIWYIVLGLEIFHQFTGHTMAILVSRFVFDKAFDDEPSYLALLAIGVLQILAILLLMSLVDVLGRLPLLITSAIGVTFAALVLGTCLSAQVFGWLSLVALCVHLTMFAFGYECVPWIMIAEIFPVKYKIFACPFAVGIFWLTKTLISCINQTFRYYKIVESDFQFGFVFIGFATVTLFGIFFILFLVPETKRKTFAEIENIFK